MSYGQYSPNHTSRTNPLADKPKAGKRQRQVYPSKEIAHLWAHQAQQSARNAQGNFYFDGPSIWSYGAHFEIARHVVNKRGDKAVLMTVQTYSNTTAKHIHAVRLAIPPNVPVFAVPSMSTVTDSKDHAVNLEYFVTQATERIEKASRARSSYMITSNLGCAQGYVDTAKAYATFFKVRAPKLPTVPEVDSDKLVAIKKQEREKQAKRTQEQEAANTRREAENKHAREEWEAKLPLLCDQWRNGANVHIARPSYGWYSHGEAQPTVPTMLRISGNEVETSHGVRVPLSHALRVLRAVQRVVSSGVEFVPNGHTLHVGHYTVDRIQADGTLKAGCHVISYAEIMRLTPALEARVATLPTIEVTE